MAISHSYVCLPEGITWISHGIPITTGWTGAPCPHRDRGRQDAVGDVATAAPQLSRRRSRSRPKVTEQSLELPSDPRQMCKWQT